MRVPTGTRPGRGSLRLPLQALIALTCFLIVAGALRSRLPWPESSGFRAKLEYFVEHKDEFDVLFFGSSRVLCGVAPREFDEELAEHGLEVRSFNLALGGMEAFETDYLLRRVLDLEPAALRWVVIEYTSWDPVGGWTAIESTNLRRIAWHTSSGTRDAVEAILVARVPFTTKLTELGRQARFLGLWVSNVGQAFPALDHARGVSRLPPRTNPLFGDDIPGLQGWHPMFNESYGRRAWSKRVKNLLNAGVRSQGEKVDLRDFPTGVLERQVERVRSRGMGLLYLGLSFDESLRAQALLERGTLPELFAYTSPLEHPELYRYEQRADVNHMNPDGARALSRVMAKDFARLLEEKGW